MSKSIEDFYQKLFELHIEDTPGSKTSTDWDKCFQMTVCSFFYAFAIKNGLYQG